MDACVGTFPRASRRGDKRSLRGLLGNSVALAQCQVGEGETPFRHRGPTLLAGPYPRCVAASRTTRAQPFWRRSLKIGRWIIVAATGLAFVGPAHAQGGRTANANPLQVFESQLAAPAAAARIGAEPETARQIVRASWYGGGERLSQHTSSGEIFRPMGQTAAHRTLPFGTHAARFGLVDRAFDDREGQRSRASRLDRARARSVARRRPRSRHSRPGRGEGRHRSRALNAHSTKATRGVDAKSTPQFPFRRIP